MSQKLFNFESAHITRVPFIVKYNKIPHPVETGFDSTLAITTHSHKIGNGLEKRGRFAGSWGHSTNPFVKLIPDTISISNYNSRVLSGH
jgi:hypothetical protein